MGVSSIWCFFIYGFGGLLAECARSYLKQLNVPLLGRCVLYVVCVYAWEVACGLLLDCFKARPWDYSDFDYDVMGLFTLEYAPVWFLGGLYFEYILSAMATLEQKALWKLKMDKNL